MRCSLPVAPLGISLTNTTLRGTLKSAAMLGHEVAQLALRRLLARPQHDDRADILAQHGMGDREGHDLLDRRMIHQDGVDLDRADLSRRRD